MSEKKYHKIKHFGLRINSKLLFKMHYIADYNRRSVNSEILYLIGDYVKEYENEHGTIDFNSDIK